MPPSSGAERDSPPHGERPRLRHKHSASSDHGSSRALVPMWDSSDPDRAPPPLPLNPQSPSLPSRPGTSSAIQSAHAALGERARESAALVPALVRRARDGSPDKDKALVKASHRRMQSLQPGSVRDLGLMIEGPRQLPNAPVASSPSGPPPSTPTKRTESSSTIDCSAIPDAAQGNDSSLTPIVRPTVRRPATTQSILGENVPPQSSAMLALQTMGARPRSQDGQPTLSSMTHNIGSPDKSAYTLEALSAQMLSLTNIAQSLKKDLSQLSRRSKDNATDLLSLKEATTTRDEDIRRGLRDLMGNMSDTSSRITSREHFNALLLDNKPHCPSPSNGRPFSLPRMPSPTRGFNESVDGASVSTPSLTGGAEGSASVALLDKILRGLGTKEGNETLLGYLKELSGKLSGLATAAKVDELSRICRSQSDTALVPNVAARFKTLGDPGSEHNSEAALSRRVDQLLNNGEPRRASAPPGRGAELLNEDLIHIIRNVKDSVAQGGGMTAEVRALVRELRGEVLGMGRELGKRLEKMGDRAIDDSEAPSRDDVSRVIDQGLEQMKESLNHVLREHRRQSQASVTSQKTLVDYQEIYNAMRAALRDNEASRGEMPDLSREDVIEAVRDAWENYKPEIEVQHLGLEREEVLTCLKEGIQEYMPRDEKPTGATREEVFKAVVEGLKHFVPPQMDTTASVSRDEIIEAVRDCLEEFEFPMAAAAIGHDMTRSDMVDAVKQGLEGLDLPRADALVAKHDNDEVLSRLHEMLEYIKAQFTAVSLEAKQNVAANGRDTEQVLDATKDGLENLRAAIESYVDRATGVAGQEEFMESLSRSMDDLKEDMAELLSHAQAQESSVGSRDNESSVVVNRDGLENLRVAMEEYVDRATAVSGHRDALENMSANIEALKEHLASAVAETSQSSREQLQTELEGIREMVHSSMVPTTPQSATSNNQEVIDALHTGLNSLRQEVLRPRPETTEILDALHEGLNELRVGIDKITNKPVDLTANDEIMDALKSGLDSVRSDIDALRDASNDKALGAVTALRNEAPHNAMIPADMIKHDDIKNLEVLMTQLRIKVEAMESPKQAEPVQQEHLARVEEMLRHVHERVDHLSSREPQNSAQSAEARDAPPAANSGDAATKEDVEAIETILRNTKALLDDSLGGEQAVRKEHLDSIESLALDTREALDSVSEQLGGVCQKSDIAQLETLLGQVGTRLDETKEVAEKDPTSDDRATKTDVEAVETLVLEMKTILDGLAATELASLSKKEDISDLATAVKEAAEKLETHADVSSKAMDNRQAEIVGVADRVTDVKAFLEEFQETVKGRLEEGATGFEALNKLVTGMSETMGKNETMGTDLKEMLDTMKSQLDESKEVVAGARLESNEKLQEAAESIGSKLDEKMAEMIAKYDELKADIDLRNAADEARNIETEAAVGGTKAVAEEVKLLIDTLGSTVTDSLEKMEEASKTVFSRVEELASRSEESHADAKTEHEQTRNHVQETVAAVGELRGEVREYQPQVLDAVKDILLLVGEHFEHSKASTSELQDKITECGAGAMELRALPPPEKYDDSELRDKLDKLAELKYDDAEIRESLAKLMENKYDDSQVLERLERLAEHKYDDATVQEKLDRIAEHNAGAAEALTKMEALEQMHHFVSKTASDVSQLLAAQTQRIADREEDQERTLQEATIAVERKLAEREHVESSVASLREEEERLRRSVASLRNEQEGLVRQKTRLTGDVSSLETAMQLRRETLSDMEHRADRLERRIMEGVMDHSRVLLMAKSGRNADEKMSRKRTKKPAATAAAAAAAEKTARPAMSMALSAKRNLATAGQTGAARRIASLSQMESSSPTSLVKRSQSVRTPPTGTTMLRKRSWGGGIGKGFDAEDKENAGRLGGTVEEEEADESTAHGEMLDVTGDETTALGEEGEDGEGSDSGTLRRSSLGTTVLTSSSNAYTGSEYSEYEGSEYTESALEGHGDEIVVYGQE